MALPNGKINSDEESPIKELSDLGKDHIDLQIPMNNELKKAPASVKLLDPEMQAAEDARAAAAATSSAEDQQNKDMLVGFGLESGSLQASQPAFEQESFTKIIMQPEPGQK